MANKEFYVGQIFEGSYPPDAAIACNQNGWFIKDIGDHRYEIQTQPEPTIDERNAVISTRRASEYARLIDPLHAEKTRKTVLGEWTEELESEYVTKVKALTKQIQDENPYIVVDTDAESV